MRLSRRCLSVRLDDDADGNHFALSPENCAPQANTLCYDTVHKIRDIALKFGTVKFIKAYLRLSDLSSGKGNNLRSDLQACGVSLTDCPYNGRKEVADKMMLGSSIFLITRVLLMYATRIQWT